MKDNLIDILKDLERRLRAVEKSNTINDLTMPPDSKFVVPTSASDLATVSGKIYYNTTTNKLKICENGTWKTITTT